MTSATGASERSRSEGPVRRPGRRPLWAASMFVLTLSLYGFWWWFDVNRQLERRGEPAKPWVALGAVTLGLVLLVPPFWSVHRTTALIAQAQTRAGRRVSAHPGIAIGLAVLTGVVAVAWVWTSLAAMEVGIFIGMGCALLAMAFVAYEQRELNRALGEQPRTGAAAPRPASSPA